MSIKKSKAGPAIIIAAFGSSRRGKAALNTFNKKVASYYSDFDIYWAFTSAIIRRKTGNPGLHQILEKVVEDGYCQAAVLPLQIFPGSEYQKIYDTATQYSGLQVVVGETLMHRREFFTDVFEVVESDFLNQCEGLNIVALHGTPDANDPVNRVYVDVEKYLLDKYENVVAAALEGVPDAETFFKSVATSKSVKQFQRARILPFMYTAGLHVEDDIMGASGSWKNKLNEAGFDVECLTTKIDGEKYYKSLASYPGIQDLFLQRLVSCLKLVHQT